MRPLPPNATLGQVVARLGAPELEVREKTTRFLQSWMQRRKEDNDLKFLEYMQIWKGLTYSVWLADRLPIIRKVSVDVVKLTRPSVSIVKPLRYSEFLAACIVELQNEWDSLDKWRVEKFQTLIRILTIDLAYQMIETKFKVSLCRSIMTAWIGSSSCLCLKLDTQGPNWFPEAKKYGRIMAPKGVTLQFVECFTEELMKLTGCAKIENITSKSIRVTDETDIDDDSIIPMSLDAWASIVTFFAKHLLSSHSDIMVTTAVFDKFVSPVVTSEGLFDSSASKSAAVKYLGAILFRIAAAKRVSAAVREKALASIAAVDTALTDLQASIDYDTLTPLDVSFAQTFEFLSRDSAAPPLPFSKIAAEVTCAVAELPTPQSGSRKRRKSSTHESPEQQGETAYSCRPAEGATPSHAQPSGRATPQSKKQRRQKQHAMSTNEPDTEEQRRMGDDLSTSIVAATASRQKSGAAGSDKTDSSTEQPKSKRKPKSHKKKKTILKFCQGRAPETICVPSFLPIAKISGQPSPSLDRKPLKSALKNSPSHLTTAASQ